MKITAETKFDLCSTQALVRHSMFRFKRTSPKKVLIILAVIYSVLFGTAMTMAYLAYDYHAFRMFLFVFIIVWGLMLYTYFIVPRTQYKAAVAKMNDLKNTYAFTDGGIAVSSNGDGYSGSSEITYEKLCRAAETNEYFFLYINKRQAFVVDKSTFEGGTADELTARLVSALGKKYMRCRY